MSQAWNVRCSWRISVWFRASAKLCSNNWPWPQKLRCRTELLWKTDQKDSENPWTAESSQNHHRISTEYPQNLWCLWMVFGNFGLREWSWMIHPFETRSSSFKPTLQVDKNAPRQRRAAAKQPAVSWCSVASLRSTMRWDPQCLVVSQWCLDMFRATPAFKKRIAGKTVVKLALYLYVKKFIEHNCFFFIELGPWDTSRPI